MESQQEFSREDAKRAILAALEHHRAGRLAQAEEIYRRVLVAFPRHPDALQLLGACFGQKGDPLTAVDLIARALTVRPNSPELYANLGEFLHQLGRLDESRAAYQKAIELNPNDPSIRSNFGVSLAKQANYQAAVEQLQIAVKLRNDLPEAHNNLAAALHSLGRLDEALAQAQTALAMGLRIPGVYHNLGNILYSLGKFSDNIAVLNDVLAANPNDPKLHLNVALAYLVTGDFQRGWKEFQWREKVPDIAGTRRFPQPRWDGSPLNGRRILLHRDQGFGDIIQFARFIKPVHERGGKVILELPREMIPLLRPMIGVEEIAERGKPLPAFDLHCPLLSLAGIFAVTEKTIPAQIPYLSAEKELAAKWAAKFDPSDPRLRVGLVWAGTAAHNKDWNRSIKLETLAPLGAARNAAFYSLQVGPPAAQAANPPPELALADWSADLTDFSQTAALIENLDLVITVDTAVAHLAGAMGKNVWLLLAKFPDWRWMLDRPDTPWYPTMRLFRQSATGDWPGVVNQAAAALAGEKKS